MDPGQFPAFRPHPLLRSGHTQTILGRYLRSRVPGYAAIRRSVKLEDGDFIILHDDTPGGGLILPESTWGGDPEQTGLGQAKTGLGQWHSGSRVVLLIHGLGGSFRTGYMPRVAARLNASGFRTFRMDLRGWGAGQHVARKTVHAGMSDDVAAVLRYIGRLCPKSPITLVGFSLGGNLALKLAGELGDRPLAGLDSVMAAAPPIDLVQCARNIRRGVNRIYDRSFVKSLHRNLRQRTAILPDDERLRVGNLPRRMFEFDDQVTAPLNGYRDAEDYYRNASSGPLLVDIRVPTLILAAEDDPIIPPRMFEQARLSSTVNLHVTRHGGHLGFVGSAGSDPDNRWLDWRVVQAIHEWDRKAHSLITGPERSAAPGAGGGHAV